MLAIRQRLLTVFSTILLGSAYMLCTLAQGGEPMGRIFFNEDDSARFGLAPAGEITPQHLDRVVDGLADSQVKVMVICCCAQKTNFPSKAWETHCEGFDPDLGNDQPYLNGAAAESVQWFRQWAENMWVLHHQDVDPTGRMIDRCREKSISPWVSIRMNDMHHAHLPDSPIHSRFWKEHPEYWCYQERFNSWADRAFNYGKKPVRDHMMSLIRELCERYDFDGLELDWLRFPYHFREGEEIEKGQLVTEWIGEVYQLIQETAKKKGHPIVLAARVPARPEVSQKIGLDALTWAKRGIIDHLIVSPFWATTDFDIPVEEWRRLIKGTDVSLTAGLEIRVQPYPGSQTIPNTPERMRGAAMAALARGSDGIYLFNYMGLQHSKPFLFKELGSIETLQGKDRSYVLTYGDIAIPGQPISHALPKELAPSASGEFRLYIGPSPEGATGQVLLTFSTESLADSYRPKVELNGHMTQFGHREKIHTDTYRFDGSYFKAGYNTITVKNIGEKPLIESVELVVQFAQEEAKE